MFPTYESHDFHQSARGPYIIGSLHPNRSFWIFYKIFFTTVILDSHYEEKKKKITQKLPKQKNTCRFKTIFHRNSGHHMGLLKQSFGQIPIERQENYRKT